MKPVKFDGYNTVYAENQSEYLPLPAYKTDDLAITCWKLSFMERIQVLFTGRIWHWCLHFGMKLQPVKLTVERPFEDKK